MLKYAYRQQNTATTEQGPTHSDLLTQTPIKGAKSLLMT